MHVHVKRVSLFVATEQIWEATTATTTNIVNSNFIMFFLFYHSPKSIRLIVCNFFFFMKSENIRNWIQKNIMNQNECRIPNAKCQVPGLLQKGLADLRTHCVLQSQNISCTIANLFLIGILSTYRSHKNSFCNCPQIIWCILHIFSFKSRTIPVHLLEWNLHKFKTTHNGSIILTKQ